ncbi:hypothetical protein ACFL3G_02525 [Planctomycetota bacterium]
MKCYSYIIARDYGFAPNPFGLYCTLATCKPGIRKRAVRDDWIIGTGSACGHGSERLVFAMKVAEKLDFNEYWSEPRFIYKKPVLNGSLKQMYGDNVYVKRSGKWRQADSHHSHADGTENIHNLQRDTSQPYVLVSEHFYYFGRNAVAIPKRFREQNGLSICKKGPGYRCHLPDVFVSGFIKWLENNHSPGYKGNPLLFTAFERYDGIS